MIKHDAVRRALGAAWVVIFLTTLVLPIGTASGASRPVLSSDEGAAPVPFVAAQGEFPPALEEAPPADPVMVPAAEPASAPPAAPPAAPSEQRTLAAQATLDVRQQTVEVASATADDWTPGRSGQAISSGQRIRTDGTGSARLVYLEGSATTINPNSGIRVDQIEQTEGGNIVTRLFQAAGSTLSRVTGLVDAGARFEVETPAATAFVRGTDLGVSERPSTGPQTFVFQNLSNPPGSSPVQVEGFGRSVTIVGGQETVARVGEGPGQAQPLGNSAQTIQSQAQSGANLAGNTAAQAQAQQSLPAAQQGAQQAFAIQQAQQRAAQQQAAQQAIIARQIPPPPPPPPPPILFNPDIPFSVACVTPTPTRTLTPAPTGTFTPTITLTPTNTPLVTVSTPVPAATNTPTAIPTGVTATTVPTVVGAAPPGIPQFVCTPVPVATFTVASFTLRSFNVTASLTSTQVVANTIPQIVLQTAGGAVTFNCTNIGVGGPGVGGTRFTTTCTGTTATNLIPGSPVIVRFARVGGGFLEVTGFVSPTLSGTQPGVFATILEAIDPELGSGDALATTPDAARPLGATRLTDYGASLFHAPFDAVRQAQVGPDEPAVGALGPTWAPLLGGLAAPLLEAVPRAATRPDVPATRDLAARSDGLPERIGWQPAPAPFRL